MNQSDKKKLIGANAAIWAGAMLASFVLPMIAESITEGRGQFLKMMAHIFPLICGLAFSSRVLSQAIEQKSDQSNPAGE